MAALPAKSWVVRFLQGKGIPFALTLLLSVQTTSLLRAEPIWLPPGSQSEAALNSVTEWRVSGAELTDQSLFGKLLFNSPTVLGEKAVRIGLSCNSCHPNGHVNTGFFIPGLSDIPGSIDLTNAFWGAGAEDEIFNPIPIPTLRGIKKTGPYGSSLNLPTIAAFTRHVIVDEFAGHVPTTDVLDALTSYMNLLDFAPENGAGSSAPTHVQTISLIKVFDLFSTPLAEKDAEKTALLATLVREELGRRSNRNSRADLLQAVQAINDITRNIKAAPAKAEAAYKNLQAQIKRGGLN